MKSELLGRVCIVLHGHIPYVLHHGTFPHGEHWLYEAAAECYLPLLDLIDETARHGSRPALSIGLTPVLLEQLAHDHFKQGFVRYLSGKIEQAGEDREEFLRAGDEDAVELAERWAQYFGRKLSEFEGLNRDLPAAFAHHARKGRIEILSGPATHPYLPLSSDDSMILAQLREGHRIVERHCPGSTAGGVWLPECGYRPAESDWKPPVLHAHPRPRQAFESLLASVGADHFFVDASTLMRATPATNSTFDPVGVSDNSNPAKVFAFARCIELSAQVWSSVGGYPASGEYLEFHRRHRPDGLRYHRVTNPQLALHQKQSYVPEDTFVKIYEHAQHFASTVRRLLSDHKARTGRPGTLVAPFDAELFGHWWHEGPQFLRDVIYVLARDPSVQLVTSREALDQSAELPSVRLSEGSWGKGNDHQVWLNDQSRWMWETIYRAEHQFTKLIHILPWRTDAAVREMMQRAARELLLLQSSDWPFVVHSRGAPDYGHVRFSLHATRFERAMSMAEDLSAGRSISSPARQAELAEMDTHDVIFRDVDLAAWL